MDYKKLMTNSLVSIVVMFLTACVHSGSKAKTALLVGEGVVGPIKAEKITAVGNPTVATLSLGSGVKLVFVDAGDDHVGIVERIPEKASSVMLPLISKWTASPLEIYLAFKASADDIPKALLTDHKLQMTQAGNANAPPRRLQPPQSGTAAPPQVESFPCGDGTLADPWSPAWVDEFEDVTDFVAVDRDHHVTVYTIYPGSHIYNGTGTNRKTYLGGCSGDTSEPDNQHLMKWEVHRWSLVAQAWVLVAGTDLTIGEEERYLFYSGHPTGRYRARVSSLDELTNHVGLGGAWTKSFPLTAEF